MLRAGLKLLLCLLLLTCAEAATAAASPRVRLLSSTLTPYVGETLILQLEIDHPQLPRSASRYRWPELASFARRELPAAPLVRGTGRLQGHWIETVSLALTPLWPGDFSLAGAGIEVRGELLPASPLRLHARPLPGRGRPADFAGTVATLTPRLEQQAAGDGSKLLLLTLSGSGSLVDLALPEPELAPGVTLLRLSDHTAAATSGVQQRQIRYRLLNRLPLLDQVTFHFSYFDPTRQRYRQADVRHGTGVARLALTLLLLLAGGAATWLAVHRWRRRPRTLVELLSRRLGHPVSGWSQQQLSQQLVVHEPELVARLQHYWRRREQQLFSVATAADRSSLRATERELLRSLRKSIDKQGRLPALSGLLTPRLRKP